MEIGGAVAPGYEKVRDAFAYGQANDEGGAQLAVYRHGRKVVDIWGGRDRTNNRPFDSDTITVLMSCTKGAVAVCANLLVQRGQLDLDAPVASYWPEFGQAGKGDIRVRHLLTHSAGLMGFDPDSGIVCEDYFDPEKCAAEIARTVPFWPAGTAYAYHFVTYGWLVGEVIRRVTGKSVGHFFADEVAGPLKLDFWIGLPESEEHRVAPHFRDAPSPTREQWITLFRGFGADPDSRFVRMLIHTFTTVDAFLPTINSRRGHACELAAGGGITNARSLAKMYAACIGEVEGVRLFTSKTMERARSWQTKGLPLPDLITAMAGGRPSQRFGLGFELNRPAEPMLGEGSFGHAGAGGRMGFAHPESGFAVAYVCNNMLWDSQAPDLRWVGWTEALSEMMSSS